MIKADNCNVIFTEKSHRVTDASDDASEKESKKKKKKKREKVLDLLRYKTNAVEHYN